MMRFRTGWMALCTLLVAALGFDATAQEVSYSGPLESFALERVDADEAVLPTELIWTDTLLYVRVLLDGDGEAFVDVPRTFRNSAPLADSRLGVRLPDGVEVSGTVYLPNIFSDGYDAYRFTIPGAKATDQTPQHFYEIKAAHFNRLAAAGIPGAAWFRHQSEKAWNAALKYAADEAAIGEVLERRGRFRTRLAELERTYDLFTGGRAIAESLQLDRELDTSSNEARTVAIDSLLGIDVEEIDWTERIAGLTPALDPLASVLPVDQHAAFFPSLAALSRVLDESEDYGTPVIQMMEPRAESAGSRARYQAQLCVELGALEQALGALAIEGLALTGSDSYFRTGTDVALLLECRDADAMLGYLKMRHADALKDANCSGLQGDFSGLPYSGVTTADRSVSSFVARHGNIILLSNSLQQVEKFAALAQGGGSPLAASPEYLYFRDRYPRGAAQESAFVILTDATIRRWGGAHWRIGAARRTHAASEMSEVHAASIVAGTTKDEAISEEFNTLQFLTPIAELQIDKVTQSEADSYTRFRNRYQNDWRDFFDPIAASLELSPTRVSLDLSVIPLIGGSDYRELLDLTRGAELAGDEGDPHEGSLFHWVMALDTQSATFRQFGSLALMVAPGLSADPMAWVGNAISLYGDQDEFWEELSAAEDTGDFLEAEYYRLPLALHIEVDSALSLTAFLTALRAFSGQAAPDMTVWETRTHLKRSYVRIAASADFAAEEPSLGQLAIYYAAMPGSFVLSLREDIIQRAIERHTARRDSESPAPPSTPWLGKSLAMRFDGSVLRHELLWSEVHPEAAAWRNLPILNAWHARYPDRDPVEVHAELWHTELLCPGGGSYVWNDAAQTMESTLYGHPGAPRLGPRIPAALLGLQFADFGLTFEDDGLRARAVLERE